MTKGNKYYQENKVREMVLILNRVVSKGLPENVAFEKNYGMIHEFACHPYDTEFASASLQYVYEANT